jgi:23S rRNA (guanine2445-N2)-methyltransferase / 23S rRNA (guanine2069-N7)-methyltransferase
VSSGSDGSTAGAAALVGFCSCPKGAEELLEEELKAIGADSVRRVRAGASLTGDLRTLYRACMWTRVGSRVLLQIGKGPANDPEELYAGVASLPWEDHVPVDGTLAVDFVTLAPGIRDTRYGGQLVKDAVVDRLRERFGRRPSVDAKDPDVRINVSVRNATATVAIDLSGRSLHRRGWREEGVQHAAPLKENLAAAIVIGAGWPQLARDGWGFADPMCGSGTLVIEAACIAADRAPGLLRERWGFSGWLGHDEAVWAEVVAEARERATIGSREVPPIVGSDIDEQSLAMAGANALRAGVASFVEFDVVDVADVRAPGPTGLVACNPPYGERIDAGESGLGPLYRRLGKTLHREFGGWKAAILTADRNLAHELRLPSPRSHTLYNGAIECELLLAELPAADPVAPRLPGALAVQHGAAEEAEPAAAYDATSGSAAFANRLRKNARRLGKWARRAGIECYRLYDSDLPDYAVAIDRYGPIVVIAEYAPPAEIDPATAERRLAEAVAIVPEVLEVDPADVHLKVRRRQRGAAQYEPVARERQFSEVHEGGLTFLVNMTDYLDTGLFLDHRPTRAMVREMAAGARFANLFCYTGVVTAFAVDGGASSSVSVDLSTTYLDWARRNLEVNGLAGPEHTFVREDVGVWLDAAPDAGFDLVFCDPPTFSNSARMEGTFDVRRDHAGLLRRVRRILAEDGTAIFSTNARSFTLDTEVLEPLFVIEDITGATTPEDFARRPGHKAWRLTPR